ncbi:MAG: xanthine dehydrogenase family protein molybdopterin-binding subunit [Devosia sp.]
MAPFPSPGDPGDHRQPLPSAWPNDSYPVLRHVGDKLFRHIGKPIERKEDQRLVTGKGRFSDDFSLPGQTFAAMVRSPHAHARIRSIDAAAALAMPGVLAVVTGQDLLDAGLVPVPHNPVPSTRYDVKLTAPGGGKPFIGPHLLLPVDKARHVGEAVAMVIAETAAQAADAAEQVEVDYEELPFVVETAKAFAPGAPAVWDEVHDNVFIDSTYGDEEATDRAFAGADHVVKARFHIPRVTAVTMEPRAALGAFDAETGRFTLWAGSGGAVRQKRELAEVLGIRSSALRVLSFDVGGNFGARNRVYVEFGLVLFASRLVGRPVKFTATRSEAFLTDYQGRDLLTTVELALDKSGKFLALRADNVSNVGMRCVSLSPLSKGSGLITGSYVIPHATLRARAVFTNTMCTQAYRSSGRPEVTYAIERIVDIAARKLGFDPFELRRKNLVPPEAMPYRNAVDSTYDSGTYEANMDRVLELAGWTDLPERRMAAKRRGRLLGFGFANYVESSIGTPKERSEITVKADGSIAVVIGTQPSGQGHETSFAQVVADMLEVPVAQVNIVLGDTDIVSVGGGSHSGRSMRHAGTVMALASDRLIEEALNRGAKVFDVPREQMTYRDGRVVAEGTNLALDLFELAERTEADFGPLAATADNEMHTPVFPNGAAVCEVEIDPETGLVEITRYTSVDDVGRCINPLIVHGQTHGGIAQGVGQAMWELSYVDPETGQPLAGSFMDYGLPRADTLPFFTAEIAEVISPTNPLGIKAGGEGGTTPALATVTLAVLDALRPLGVSDIKMPVTPLNVWTAIQKAKSNPNTDPEAWQE